MVRIHWHNPATGASGHGEPISAEAGEVWLLVLRERYPNWIHNLFQVSRKDAHE
jgi:hypothetical protein